MSLLGLPSTGSHSRVAPSDVEPLGHRLTGTNDVGRYYDETPMPASLRRNYDVYPRIRQLGIDLGSYEQNVVSLAGRNIALTILTESGLTFISGTAKGVGPLSDEDESVSSGKDAGAAVAAQQICWLHWALSCGGEGGDLNDVLYTVKGLGFVVSPRNGPFTRAPEVVNGYSFIWHSVFGGPGSAHARMGIDPGGWSGVHARSALGGIDGRFAQESEMVVAIPPALSRAIIANRGWVFPLPPNILGNIQRRQTDLGGGS